MNKLFITCSWFRFYFYYLFIHMPWNNQVVIFSALTKFWFPFSRDDYDKEVKQAKELQRRRHTTTPRRPRRPDMQVYHPRRRRKTDVLSLDFCADCAPISGKIMCVCVCALIVQMVQSQGPVLMLKKTRVDQAQRLTPVGLNSFGLNMKQILVPLHPSLCTRLMPISFYGVFSSLVISCV